MNIFCKETEAHLQLHPHLSEEGGSSSSGPGGLITPDLWLRDCRSASPSASPSPPPEPPKDDSKKKSRKMGKIPGKITYPPPLLPMNLVNPNLPPPRPPFAYFPQLRGPRLPSQMISPPPPPPPSFPTSINQSPFKSVLPPVTIFIPIPIPIPIPIDITKLAFLTKNKAESEKTDKSEVKSDPADNPVSLTTNDAATSSAFPRPLRKRRRVAELSKDTETVSKRKIVPA